MRKQFIWSVALSALLTVTAFAQTSVKPVTIGDKAPEFKSDGVAKGKAIDPTKPGRVYVVEFWATWCGPCIQAMPHLSDMAEKFAKDVDFVSVNAYDYKGRGTPQQVKPEEHKPRILEFIEKNSDKMRYNIAFDDSKGSIATSWMSSTGQNGIPCAFIVNKQGQLAWVGHPMSMDEPLQKIVNGTWDLNAFKAEFEKQAAKTRAVMEMNSKVAAAVDSKNVEEVLKAATVDGKPNTNGVQMSIAMAARKDAAFAANLVEFYVNKSIKLNPYMWSSMASTVTTSTKDASIRSRMKKVSENAATGAQDSEAALAYTYHARMLLSIDEKTEALDWANKAKSKMEFVPDGTKEQLSKFIDATIKMASSN